MILTYVYEYKRCGVSRWALLCSRAGALIRILWPFVVVHCCCVWESRARLGRRGDVGVKIIPNRNKMKRGKKNDYYYVQLLCITRLAQSDRTHRSAP